MLGRMPVQEVMRVASAQGGIGRRDVLLVAGSANQLADLSGLVEDLRHQVDVVVRTCYVARLVRPTDLWGQEAEAERPHRLAGWRTHSGWRRAVTSIASPLTPRRRRVHWALSLDPWFRRSARSATDVVSLGGDGDLVTSLVHRFAAGTTVHDGPDGLSRLVHDIARRRLEAALGTAHGGGSRTRWDEASLDAAVKALRAAQVLPHEHLSLFHDELLSLPRLTRDPAQVRCLVTAVRTLLPGPSLEPALTAYLARADLDERGTTAADPARVAADLLTSSEPLLRDAGDLRHAVARTVLALEVLFHRELHSDSVASPLVTDPAGYLEPVRSTSVWQLLTQAVPDETMTGARIADAGGPETGPPPPPDRCRVRLLPGSYGPFLQPVVEALKVSPAIDVAVVRRKELRPHLRTMGVTPDVVERRLAAALGRPFHGYPELVDLLASRSSDVVVLDWADKTAVLGTLLVPSEVRVVLRVHGVDVLRPWVHLLDWSRVDAVICVAPALRELLVEVVGDPLRDVPVHVVPNLLDMEGLGRVATRPRDPRTLGVVGWAQKVKDPLWAVEVLAALRRDGGDWRLLLIGADFKEEGTASGAAYASAFRERAVQDDVREHIEYTGFVDDLAPVLARCSFVLSSSLRESWPVGLAEGVAAGAVPVVRDWPMLASRNGARSLYGDAVVDTVEEAVDRIRSVVDTEGRSGAAQDARAALAELADTTGTTSRLREIALGEVGRLADLSATGRHEEAVITVRAILDGPRPAPALLSQAAVSAARAGEPTLRLEVLRRWAEYGNERVRQLVRHQEGRLRELTPGWLPSVADPSDRVTHADDGARRVLHLLKASLPQRRSGYTMRSAYLLGEQVRAGIDVVAVTALDYPPPEHGETSDDRRGPREETVRGVRHRRLLRPEIPRPDYPDDYLDSFASALATVVSEERPSVIHVHSGHRGYDLALVALAVGRATELPVVYEVRGFFEALWTTDLDRAETSELYRLRREIETWCMQEAAAVTTLSESMRDDILARPGVDSSAVFVVPNGVDPQALAPRPRRADLAARLGLGDAFTFGYVSNLDHPREGQELLVRAVRTLRGQGLDAKALVVGGGVRAEALQDLARQLDVEEHVIFTGYVDHAEVGDYYALLDVFVVPRVDERAARLVTPIKPYEAMAMHLPVVVSDLPALLEIVGGGTRGRAFAAGDAAALAEVLHELAHDPGLREQLAEAGHRWVLERRTWEAAAARYAEVYDVATTLRPPRSGKDR